MQPKTVTSISETLVSTNRKNAARSEFSTNLSTTSDNEYSVTGPIPELPHEPGWIKIDKAGDNALSRRTRGIEYNLVIFILSRTTSAAARPEYAVITIADYRMRTGASERNIYCALAKLESNRLIARDKQGRVKACPENFGAAPLPAARTCRRRERVAAVRASSDIAALQLTAVDEPAVVVAPAIKPAAVDQAPAAIEPAAAPLQLTAVEPETNCRKPETYCPWNWTCPHLSTTSELVSIKHLSIEESTTTGGSPAIASEIENAYLARFLNPAQRIGDQLQIDDTAAARMWNESSARNHALTPREFLLIVRMKLREWNRESDARPGRKITSPVGMLIRSMPNAVEGALYLAAHQEAPAELARDRALAREILAGEPSPRDRAWALGILSES